MQKIYFQRDSSPLLYLLNHEEFADKILPVVQKSLLRNPELDIVGELFNSAILSILLYEDKIYSLVFF